MQSLRNGSDWNFSWAAQVASSFLNDPSKLQMAKHPTRQSLMKCMAKNKDDSVSGTKLLLHLGLIKFPIASATESWHNTEIQLAFDIELQEKKFGVDIG